MRELRLVFGFSTGASAAVVAIFLGGLGLGSRILGRRTDSIERPLEFYGKLELGIAASAAVTPALLWLVRQVYLVLGGSLAMGAIMGSVVRLVLSALVLLVPTFLMGGTLPAASRAVETDEDSDRRRMAVLYGANTLGAVVGTALSTFWLLEVLGTRYTLWAACLFNAGIALLAISIGKKIVVRDRDGNGETEAGDAAPEPAADDLAPRRFVLAASCIVGFAFTLMELVWYRMLAPLLGGSTYTFGLILAVALAGIGLGAAALRPRVADAPGHALGAGDHDGAGGRVPGPAVRPRRPPRGFRGADPAAGRLRVPGLHPDLDAGHGDRRLPRGPRGRVSVSPARRPPGPRPPGRGRGRRHGLRLEHARCHRRLAGRGFRPAAHPVRHGDLEGGHPALGRPERLDNLALPARGGKNRPPGSAGRVVHRGERAPDPGDRADRGVAAQPHRRRPRPPRGPDPQPDPGLETRSAAQPPLGRGRPREQRRLDQDARRLGLRHQREGRRELARRRGDAGDERHGGSRAPSQRAQRDGGRPRHRIDGGMAGAASLGRARGRRRARSGDPRRRARLRVRSTATCSRTPRSTSRSETPASTS